MPSNAGATGVIPGKAYLLQGVAVSQKQQDTQRLPWRASIPIENAILLPVGALGVTSAGPLLGQRFKDFL